LDDKHQIDAERNKPSFNPLCPWPNPNRSKKLSRRAVLVFWVRCFCPGKKRRHGLDGWGQGQKGEVVVNRSDTPARAISPSVSEQHLSFFPK
jgi:hypothetical protein